MTFKADLNLANDPIILKQFDLFYKEYLGAKVIQRFEKDKDAQFTYHTDVVITLEDGTRYSIDEKLRRMKYKTSPLYPLETWSNYPQRRGCFFTSLASMFIFATLKDDKTKELDYFFLLPLTPAVKNYVKNCENDERLVNGGNQLNKTKIKLVHYTKLNKFGSVLYEDQLIVGDF